MKLKNQLIISLIIFGIILIVISLSVVVTNQQVANITNQEQIANDINTGASTLAYISNDYFLNKQSADITLWQAQFSTLSTELSKINPTTPELTEQINNVKSDMQQLNTVFTNSATYLQSIPASESGTIPPLLKTYTTRLNLQNQALAFDASVLSKALSDQVDQTRQTNSSLLFVLLGAFGAYFVTVYMISYRLTFRSMTKLQEETKIIGSGNLDYQIAAESKDEIGDLAKAFNQMTANLKATTASKTDLENEVAERKKVEKEREIVVEFLRIANENTGLRDLIRATTSFFQKHSGCEAVGIRLQHEEDYPYYETRGFPPEHVQLENKLCATDPSGCIIRDFKGDPILECMCGNIICRRFDSSKEFFTQKGSFWTNDTTRLLANTTDADRQAHTRNRCNGEGYESVALIPLVVGNNTLGLLQLNDKRKNMFTLETIQMYERIADHLALALSKNLTDESLRESEQRWATTLSSIGDSVIATNVSGEVTFMNKVAEHLTGWTLAEASGKPLKDVFHIINEKTRKEVESPLIKVLKFGVVVGLANHTILVRRDGTENPIDDSGAPIKDEDGKTTGVVLIFRDITERKKAEEALRER